MADATTYRVAFDQRGLRPLLLVAAVLGVGGVGLLVDDAVLLGVDVPTPLRCAFGGLALLLAGWLIRSVVRRRGSDDDAVRLDADVLRLHVNPGRVVVLRRDEVLGVGPVQPVPAAARRWVLGAEVFEIETTRPEGLRASAVVVGSRYIVGDLHVVRDQLAFRLLPPRGAS